MEITYLICAIVGTVALLGILGFVYYALRISAKRYAEQQTSMEQKYKELIASVKRLEDAVKGLDELNHVLAKDQNQHLASISEQIKQSQLAIIEEVKVLKKSIDKLENGNAKGFEDLKKCLEDVVKL